MNKKTNWYLILIDIITLISLLIVEILISLKIINGGIYDIIVLVLVFATIFCFVIGVKGLSKDVKNLKKWLVFIFSVAFQLFLAYGSLMLSITYYYSDI